MALSEGIAETKAVIAAAIAAKLEDVFPIDEDLPEADQDQFRSNFANLGAVVAEALDGILDHIVDHAEIGTVTSDVAGAEATQNNAGEGLIQ